MEELEPVEYRPVTILDVLGVDLCARAILDRVPVADLVRSERVSRRWQRAVSYYLQTCRTLSYEGFRYAYNYLHYPVLTTDHRTIKIHNQNHSLLLVRKTLHKWGPYIVKVITDIGEDTYLDIIVSECLNLEQIELVKSEDDGRGTIPLTKIKFLKQLKQIILQYFYRLSETKHSDLVLGELLQDITCENITIIGNQDLTGSFLKSLTSDSLISLCLTGCLSLRVSDLLSAVDNIRNLTSLEMEDQDDEPMLNDVHLLLVEMPQLEQLILRLGNLIPPLREDLIQALCRLGNLKRLALLGTRGGVDDSFLEKLARGCRKLERLMIDGSAESVTARGVRALCHRSPSARTTLHFPLSEVVQDIVLEKLFLRDFKDVPLYKELAALGCVELTLEWFVAACRDPRGRELSLNPTRGSRAEEPQKELKLIIFSPTCTEMSALL